MIKHITWLLETCCIAVRGIKPFKHTLNNYGCPKLFNMTSVWWMRVTHICLRSDYSDEYKACWFENRDIRFVLQRSRSSKFSEYGKRFDLTHLGSNHSPKYEIHLPGPTCLRSNDSSENRKLKFYIKCDCEDSCPTCGKLVCCCLLDLAAHNGHDRRHNPALQSKLMLQGQKK